MNFLRKNPVAVLGVAVCLFNLILDQCNLWVGKIEVISFNVLFPICRYLVKAALPTGADWHATTHIVYSVAFLVYYVAFAALFWESTKASSRLSERKLSVIWSTQLALALICHGQLINAIVPQLAYRLPLRRALWWLLAVTIIGELTIALYLTGTDYMSPAGAITRWYFPFQIVRDNLIFFSTGYVALLATQHRAQLASANAELLTARQQLGEAARTGERLRIARELHDTLGHQLTALNLHLDLTVRQSGDKLAPAIGVAREVGQQLLSNIRRAIDRERLERPMDLQHALQALCKGVPHPRVALYMDAGFTSDTPDMAHMLFSCVQEGITNAVRHANAGIMGITLKRDADGITLNMSDDGKGFNETREGNGLRGMRERVAALSGSMQIGTASGGGCRIDIYIPTTGQHA